MRKNVHAVALGRKGGQANTLAQHVARATTAKAQRKPCVCGHGTAEHRYQRDGSRKACKICPCVRFLPVPKSWAPFTGDDRHLRDALTEVADVQKRTAETLKRGEK